MTFHVRLVKLRKWRHLLSKFDTISSKVQKYVTCTYLTSFKIWTFLMNFLKHIIFTSGFWQPGFSPALATWSQRRSLRKCFIPTWISRGFWPGNSNNLVMSMENQTCQFYCIFGLFQWWQSFCHIWSKWQTCPCLVSKPTM